MYKNKLISLLTTLVIIQYSCIASAMSNKVNLYDVYEIKVQTKREIKNPFDALAINLQARFISPSGDEYISYGFYDGKENNLMTWKVRFNPDKAGIWKYTLKSNANYFILHKKSFTVTEKPSTKHIHGHVLINPENKRTLIHKDGSPHYWVGGKWISARDYGPRTKLGVANRGVDPSTVHYGYKSNEQFIKYLSLLEKYKHNGILIKIALYPLEKDNISWDIEWIQRAEWLVMESLKRGINVQINIFDTWSRDKNKWFENNIEGSMQPFNVWLDGDDYLKENYIKNLISRFASYSNVYWELGNEMEHYPNNGNEFIKLSNKKYIPWIRKYDPYNLPIGLSEGIWQKTNVDIGFLHQTNQFPIPDRSKPVIMNELVNFLPKPTLLQRIMRKLFGAKWPYGLWHDSSINNPELRFAYRRTFWNVFTNGGAGTSEATWLNINNPYSDALLNVMRDHMYLKEMLDKHSSFINTSYVMSEVIHATSIRNSTRGLDGKFYVTYFEIGNNNKVTKSDFSINIPTGKYSLTWLNPKTGKVVLFEKIYIDRNSLKEIEQPGFSEDIVLIIKLI